MAILRVIRPPELTRERYDAITSHLAVSTDHPLGLIMHSAGEVDGVWQIVEVWESEEYAQRFDRDRLGPAIVTIVGSQPPPATTVGYELHQLVTP